MTPPVQVEIFEAERRSVWDEFVRESRNGTFLLTRDYLEYHEDRFSDASLLFFDANGNLIAVLPANRETGHLISHSGLTYGGFVIGDSVRQATMQLLVTSLVDYARREGIKRITYTPVPWIYHRSPVESDVFALAQAGAATSQRQVMSVIPMSVPTDMTELRRRSIRKAERAGVEPNQSDDWRGFWDLLATRLAERHDSRPVHDLNEVSLLASRFPDAIRLFDSRLNGVQVAGAVVFETEHVARVQYMATTDDGRKTGALDILIHWLMRERFAAKRFLDLGSSHVPATHELNHGLLDYKEGFGARTVIQNTYMMDVDV